ncbi:unnamed protein product [Triticum turgidum subsp. durum]|uniref:Uncharacterized protein n=2 Tax=Triticum TaxID=4564 RepID=A0A9R0QI55_TRITD|nr:unnamed protein product [Triticum turgidum subsp. durum]
MESAHKKALGIVTLLVVLQLLVAAMARSPPEEMETEAARSEKIAIERLVLKAPRGDAKCADETCYTGFCFVVAGCSCQYPYCTKSRVPTPVHA